MDCDSDSDYSIEKLKVELAFIEEEKNFLEKELISTRRQLNRALDNVENSSVQFNKQKEELVNEIVELREAYERNLDDIQKIVEERRTNLESSFQESMLKDERYLINYCNTRECLLTKQEAIECKRKLVQKDRENEEARNYIEELEGCLLKILQTIRSKKPRRHRSRNIPRIGDRQINQSHSECSESETNFGNTE